MTITATVVHAHDHFDASEGSGGHLIHKPDYFNPKGRGAPIGAYAYAVLADKGEQWAIMSRAQIEAIREKSKAKDSGPWRRDPEKPHEISSDELEMWRKTTVRRIAKLLPISVDADEAFARDTEEERFREAREINPRIAALPSGAVRIEKPEAGERVAAKSETAAAEAPPHDPTTGEVLPAATPTVEPAPAKTARKPKADKPAEAPPAPAAATKPAVPSGAGLTDAVAICDELEAATEPEQVAIAEKRLAAHVAAGEMGSTSRARIDRAIEEAKKRIYGAAE